MAVRRIITAAGLTVLLCFCCCSDSPTEGGQGTPGMPNAIGMFWEYEVYDSLTQTTDTAVVSITDTVVDEQSSKYLLWRTYFRSSGLVQEKVGAATGDTFAYFITPDDKITGTFILEQFPFPLTSGKEWYNGLFAGNSKVLDVVTLTVPAMTFHDVAVVQHTDNLEGLSRTVTNCVAAGIGIVAYHEYQVRTSEPAGEVTANVTWRLLRYDLSTFPLSRFPLNEGTRWEYEVVDGDTLVTDTIRVTIGNRVSVPGPGSVHVWHFVGRSAHDSVFVFMLGQNLYFSQDAVLDTYESWIFAFPLAVGRYWGTEPWVIADINDKGPLSTSAGDFRTSFHHVRFEIRDGAPMVNKTIEEWLVPGVGIAARRFTTLGLGGPNHRIDWRLIEFMSRYIFRSPLTYINAFCLPHRYNTNNYVHLDSTSRPILLELVNESYRVRETLMTAIEILKTEHDTISIALAVLEHICQLLADKQPVEPSHLHDLAHFFQLYADRVHHAKEETLFERLDGRDSQLDRMMGSLCTQHVMAREFVHGMHEAAEKYAHGQSRAAKRFCEEAEAYRTLLTIHICDENHVLFPRIAKQLRGAEASKVTREFRALDVQLLDESATAESLKAVRKLEKLYRIEHISHLQVCK